MWTHLELVSKNQITRNKRNQHVSAFQAFECERCVGLTCCSIMYIINTLWLLTCAVAADLSSADWDTIGAETCRLQLVSSRFSYQLTAVEWRQARIQSVSLDLKNKLHSWSEISQTRCWGIYCNIEYILYKIPLRSGPHRDGCWMDTASSWSWLLCLWLVAGSASSLLPQGTVSNFWIKLLQTAAL